jgi:hypothetical protein
VSRHYPLCALLALCVLVCGCAHALRDPDELPALPRATISDTGILLERAQRLYDERSLPQVAEAAQLWLQAADADNSAIDGLVGAMRTFVWLADHASDPELREIAARRAVDAGQLCEQRAARSSECLYWMAISLGVQARERRSTGLDAVDQMIERLQAVIELDPGLDHGGPRRVLALVYLRAPSWPTGPGDPDLGLDEARRAVAQAPDYPPNLLCKAEALVATEDHEGGRREYQAAAKLAREWLDRGAPDAGEWLEEAERYLSRSASRD